ncbi:hypothetical protein PspLS_00050 [Pyricularia sp. CBS 133598]|nr:hypothetical protein PspLS_00050 [Pyricularia sp. CBS 133598]
MVMSTITIHLGLTKNLAPCSRGFDKSLAFLVWYGPEWACTSMAPSWGYKAWITEADIRCPRIVRYPPLLGDSTTALSQTTKSFCTVMDIFPTILELAGVPHPGSPFRGREVVPLRGSSWVPHLGSKSPSFHDEEKAITG